MHQFLHLAVFFVLVAAIGVAAYASTRGVGREIATPSSDDPAAEH